MGRQAVGIRPPPSRACATPSVPRLPALPSPPMAGRHVAPYPQRAASADCLDYARPASYPHRQRVTPQGHPRTRSRRDSGSASTSSVPPRHVHGDEVSQRTIPDLLLAPVGFRSRSKVAFRIPLGLRDHWPHQPAWPRSCASGASSARGVLALRWAAHAAVRCSSDSPTDTGWPPAMATRAGEPDPRAAELAWRASAPVRDASARRARPRQR